MPGEADICDAVHISLPSWLASSTIMDVVYAWLRCGRRTAPIRRLVHLFLDHPDTVFPTAILDTLDDKDVDYDPQYSMYLLWLRKTVYPSAPFNIPDITDKDIVKLRYYINNWPHVNKLARVRPVVALAH